MTYTQGDFSYFRKKGEALFPQRHTESTARTFAFANGQ
ncbi:Uncharacterised protein [Helicobacter cinaedi]|uniref:Uncharacterized protein n=1 Tax=Helicobacter cinaedi TaxID=213 RepID=A0A377JX52_9HELI|nr:Uncharacterised protein [Helicobacter cinaedi]